MSFETHQRENSEDTERHLQENQKKFSRQCELVYRLLMGGRELTSRSAMIEYGIGDVHRRISELKHLHGVEILDRWELNPDGKATRNKVWFIKIPKPHTKKELIKELHDYRNKVPVQLNLL